MKRIISILLAVMLVASCAVVASAYSWSDPDCLTVDEALDMYEIDNGERPATNTYYFLMPNGSNGELGDDPTSAAYGQYAPTWYIPFADGTLATETAGIYWWDSGVADPDAWVGYIASGREECDEDIYYANVPKAVTTLIWNNAVDGGMDESQEIYYCAAQSVNIGAEYYDPGESVNYPNGTDGFDGMIYVIDPDLVSINELSLKQTCGGEWYYYYGNGCYGFTEGGSEADCLRDDHYDENGNHVGKSTGDNDNTNPDPDYLLGDVDGDGEMSIMDATEIQMIIAGLKEPAYENAILAADVDGDGEMSIMDATEIQMIIAGLK